MTWRQQLSLAKHKARTLLAAKAKTTRHPGPTAEDVCRDTVEARWNGRFFTTSDQRHRRFTARDFGLAVRGLIHLEQTERARDSLRWALDSYAKAGRLAPALDTQGQPLDEACRAPDTLPFLLHALDQLDMAQETEAHRPFLQAQAQRYERRFIDPDSRQPIRGRMFGGFKDRVHFTSTCATLAMIGWCSSLLDTLQIAPNPLAELAVAEELEEWFWTGAFFRNDLLSQPPICSGDANLWPYWCGLIKDDALLSASLLAIRDRGLDHPRPLKFHPAPMPERELEPYRFFQPNSQGDALWSCIGLPWIEVIARIDRPRARAYLEAYRRSIEQLGALALAFDSKGLGPQRGRLGFVSDQGPIWAAEFPRLAHVLGQSDDPPQP